MDASRALSINVEVEGKHSFDLFGGAIQDFDATCWSDELFPPCGSIKKYHRNVCVFFL